VEIIVTRMLETEKALASIAWLRDYDKSVDFEPIWQVLNQYRQSIIDGLNLAQEVELELVRTELWLEEQKRGSR